MRLITLILAIAVRGPTAAAEDTAEPPQGGPSQEALRIAWALATSQDPTEPAPSADSDSLRTKFQSAQGALRAAQERGDKRAVRASLVTLAILSEQRGRYALGLAHASRARHLTPEGSDPRFEAVLLGVTGVLQMRVGQLDAAAEILEHCLALRRQAGDQAGEAATCANLALVQLRRGDAEAAVELYRRAESIQVASNLSAARAQTLVGLAAALCCLGDVAASMSCLDRAEELASETAHAIDVARVRAARGVMLRKLTRYAGSIQSLEQAETMFHAAGDRIGRARALLDLAQSEAEVGQFVRALAYLERAREVCRAAGDRVGEACALRRQAQVHAMAGEHEPAVACLRDARSVYDLIEDPVGRLWADTELANLLLRMGQLGAARALHESVLASATRLGQKDAMATAEANLGLTEFTLGRHGLARTRLQRAIEQAQQQGLQRSAMLATWALALVHQDAGNSRATVEAARRAIEMLDTGFAGMDGLSTALGRELWASLFSVGIRAAAELRDARATLLFMEYGRARSLLHAIGARSAVVAAAVPPALAQAEALARSRVMRATQELVRARRRRNIDATRLARQALGHARENLAEAHTRIQRASCIGTLVGSEPPSLVEVRRSVRPGEALVLYALAQDRAVALLITARAARVVDLGEARALRLATEALPRDEGGTHAAAARDYLRRQLLDALQLPAEVTRLVLSPQGVLGQIPYSLLAPEREVVLTPSASLWLRAPTEGSTPAEGVLAIGGPRRADGEALVDASGKPVPDLPGARSEARAVGSVILIDEAATPSAFRHALGFRRRWRAVHFACHAIIDTAHPMYSALILAPDEEGTGNLRALDVLQLRVPTDLAVLSGCSTGQGRVFRADGIMGLASAFQHAGARRVLCSLWKVDDDASSALMKKFHELWSPPVPGTGRISAAEALRAAQDYVRTQPQWTDPKYWAGWTLWISGH